MHIHPRIIRTQSLFAPNVAPRLTTVDLYSSFLQISALGFITLVKTTLGPQNTLSSKITLS